MLPPPDPRDDPRNAPPSRPYSLHRSEAPVAVPRKKALAIGVGLLALTGAALGLFVTLDRNVSINPIDEPYRGQIQIDTVKGQPTPAATAPVLATPYPEATSPITPPAGSPAIYPARYATPVAVTSVGTAPVAPAVRPATAPRQPARVLRPAPGETVTLQPDEDDEALQRWLEDDRRDRDADRPRRRHRDRDREPEILDEDGEPAPDVIIVDEPQGGF